MKNIPMKNNFRAQRGLAGAVALLLVGSLLVVASPVLASPPSAEVDVTMEVQGLDCGGCAARLQRVLSAIDGVTSAAVDFAKARADLVCASNVTSKTIRAAVADAGFQVKTLSRKAKKRTAAPAKK